MRKIAVIAAVVALGAVSAAQAGSLGRPCTSVPESQWLTLDALKAKAEALGYRVQKAKIKAACGEIYVRDQAGARAELFMDPATGAVVAKD